MGTPSSTAATNTAAGQMSPSANLTYVPQDHQPVLAEELVELLDPRPGETFVDCTFGGGGHARLIAERLGAEGELIAVDRDPSSEARWREFAADSPSRARFLRANFVAALEGLRGEGVRPDGIVFDLGMSSLQLDAWERGFSYAFDAPLDMRMDPDQKPDRGRRSSTSGSRTGWRGCCASSARSVAPARSRERSSSGARSPPPQTWSPR